jgi:hypothetical protein
MLSLSFCVKFRLANDAVVDQVADNYIPSENHNERHVSVDLGVML